MAAISFASCGQKAQEVVANDSDSVVVDSLVDTLAEVADSVVAE